MTSYDCLPFIDSPSAGLEDAGNREAPLAPADETPRQRSARASQRISALGEMTAGLAHDFRNILTTIQSGINLAERYRDDHSKAKAALDAAHEGIRRGVQLTSQLLRFARPEEPDIHSESVNDRLEGLKTFLKYGAG